MGKSLPSVVALRATFDGQEYLVAAFATKCNNLELCSSEDVWSPKVRFALEPARDGLVHIRSCYNNKYLCREALMLKVGMSEDEKNEAQSSSLVAAAANEAIEDRLAWNCTLFELKFSDDKNGEEEEEKEEEEFDIRNGAGVSLSHVASNYSIAVVPTAETPTSTSAAAAPKLVMRKSASDAPSLFTVMNLTNRLELPPKITLKGDNERYLKAYLDNHYYLQFDGTDPSDSIAHHETFKADNGISSSASFRIKAVHWNAYWRRAIWVHNNILADIQDLNSLDNKRESEFEPIHIEDDIFGLRGAVGRDFCGRFTRILAEPHFLAAQHRNLVREARLLVGELVLRRTIDVVYDLDNARFTDRTPVLMAENQVENPTDGPQEMITSFEATISTISTWDHTTSFKTSVTTTIRAGIPTIVSGSLTIRTHVSVRLHFGTSITESHTSSASHTAIVPPMTNTIVRGLLSRATYDIPFSYIQTDLLTTGETVQKTFYDGIYNGVEAYNYFFRTENRPL